MSDPTAGSGALRDLLRRGSRELACGASVDELLEQVADGQGDQLTAHQQQCPHCGAALAEFRQLWAPVHEYARAPVHTPARLKNSVMKQVDKLVQDVWYTLQLTEGGSIRIAARVVAAVARETAALVPGVRVALGRTTDSRIAALVAKATHRHRHPYAAVGVLGRTAVVELAVAVTYGDPAHQMAHEVQRRVMAELQQKIGLQTVTVNVIVDDVLPRPAS
ncbi:Asp23/Gls24 family envelope stress response protein [Jatrophihabitans lederbergiae]|uniref:Asp23/Gls24 family envelope stress response protein n=1 Tax=Jatrophihabitans lederbergiae TaxID=3075547 RepID=A0ABU2J776_9ACTN|nr:Asp23/Gls24 family envelope stress response protein [Jatrophihabitans sp. DSM 44399]MDT0260469.1 Asp23/Gls24 family envelope stress response protein [Jatrophihabitans sp. DSM 44399]